MSLVRQPRFACPISAAIDCTQNALGARKVAAHRANRHPTFADAKKGAQVAIALRVKNDTLAEFVVGDPFARLKLSLCFHAPTSSNSQVEQATGLAAFAQQNLLWIFVRLAPQDAAEGKQALAVWCRTAPFDGVGGGMKLYPSPT